MCIKILIDLYAEIGNAALNGDNISLGKRSISSEYNNPLIYDETDRYVVCKISAIF